jgi:hypothetical protein
MLNHFHPGLPALKTRAAGRVHPVINSGGYPGKTGQIATNKYNPLIGRSRAEFHAYILPPPQAVALNHYGPSDRALTPWQTRAEPPKISILEQGTSSLKK